MYLKDLINDVKKKGFNDLFNSNSLISLKDNDIFLNIPVEIKSNSSRLSVEFGPETPL